MGPAASGLRRAYDFKTDGDLYLWTSQKLRELRATNPRSTWIDAAAVLARHPVDRAHRRETVAARRKPLPAHWSRPRGSRSELRVILLLARPHAARVIEGEQAIGLARRGRKVMR